MRRFSFDAWSNWERPQLLTFGATDEIRVPLDYFTLDDADISTDVYAVICGSSDGGWSIEGVYHDRTNKPAAVWLSDAVKRYLDTPDGLEHVQSKINDYLNEAA